MADNDVYDSQGKYDKIIHNLDNLTRQPTAQERRRKYWIKHASNKKYFLQLAKKFDARDTSYVRRVRLFRTFLIVCYVVEKDLSEIQDREDIDTIVSFAHSVNKSVKSKRDFALDLKFLWKSIFPEKDEKGRIDESINPYVVRHLSGKVDRSKEKLRGDKFSIDEFEMLVKSFGNDPRMQALLTISLESLARPQEILGRKLKDVELFDNYAKIYISEHGKEGTGFLRVIDSYFYLAKWLNMHPLKGKDAPLFCNTGRLNMFKQMTPFGANKLIRDRCQKLGIDKPITLYSLKRNGVTIMRLRGASDLDIQHTARWTSTKQLKTYDLSNQEESFKIELIKRGVVQADAEHKQYQPTTRVCAFCNQVNGIAEIVCSKCQRPLDRQVLEKKFEDAELAKKDAQELKEQMSDLMAKVADLVSLKAELERRKEKA